MQKLIAGITKFQNEVFPKNRHLYQQLATGQQPDTHFICCADSRVVPNEMLQVGAGELFISRNAGNIVPPYSHVHCGTSATVEYAVEILKVRHIVVCGHSDCGAMKALLTPEKVNGFRAIRQWIRHAERVNQLAKELHDSDDEHEYLERLIEENVISQLDNLMTYPGVAARTRTGSLLLHGMTFDIGTGQVRMLDRTALKFIPLNEMAQRLVKEEQLQTS